MSLPPSLQSHTTSCAKATAAIATTKIVAPPSSGPSLGGLGTGGIELWADGTFRRPQFTNAKLWAGAHHPTAPQLPSFGPEDLCFLLWVRRPGGNPQMRFLFTGHGTSFLTWNHMPRDYKYAFIPSLAAVSHRAEFPFVHLTFHDDGLPVAVELTAWSPFVPHDHEASAYPGFLADVHVRSLIDEPLEVAVIQTGTNIAGYDHPERSRQRHARLDLEGGAAVRMSGGIPGAATTGDISLFARAGADQHLSAVAGNPHIENLMWSIHCTGGLDGPLHPASLAREEMLGSPGPSGMHRNRGWIGLRQSLAGRAVAELRFGYTWHFPHHVDKHGTPVPPFYAPRFADSTAVAAALLAQADSLKRRSAAFSTAVVSGDLDPHLALALLDQCNVLVASTWLTDDGRLFVWEGTGQAGLNTVDVDHYGSFGLAMLFPELRKGVLDDIGAAQRADGHIPHAFQMGTDPARIPDIEYHRWDVLAQFALGLHRDWRVTGDAALLARNWPKAVRAMERLAAVDNAGIGLPSTAGGITYDHWHLEGVVTYLASIYLTACSALADMAVAMGEPATAATWSERRARGIAAAERLLWLGDRYRVVHRSAKPAPLAASGASSEDLYQTAYRTASTASTSDVDAGLHTDALNGEATALINGLPRNLNESRVRKMLRLIVERNTHADARFLANGSCDNGAFPDEWPFSQWQNPWTGTEYFFAAHCFAEGLDVEGLRIVRDVHERHERAGLRFNHGECGERYSRALSIYAAYGAWLGVRYDAPAKALHIQAKSLTRTYRGPFFGGTAWGRIAIADGAVAITLDSGSLPIERVVSDDGRTVRVAVS